MFCPEEGPRKPGNPGLGVGPRVVGFGLDGFSRADWPYLHGILLYRVLCGQTVT